MSDQQWPHCVSQNIQIMQYFQFLCKRMNARKSLFLVGAGISVFLGLVFAHRASRAELLCYMESSSGEVVNLEEICREIEALQERDKPYEVYGDYEALSVTSFEYGDVVDGIRYTGPNEIVYSNGVRRLYNPETGMFTFVRPDGAEALPGEEVEIPDSLVPVIVESVAQRIGYLESHLGDDSFWTSAISADAEGTEAYREGVERQLENLKKIAD